MRRLALLLVAALAGLAGFASAARASQAPQRFDVASVKPVAHPDYEHRDSYFVAIPGRVIAEDETVELYIERAYDVRADQIAGGPGWLDSDAFTIMATSRRGATVVDQMQMLQTLLAERFKLQIKRGAKKMRGYVLTVAKSGAKIPEAPPGAYNPATPGIGPMTMHHNR